MKPTAQEKLAAFRDPETADWLARLPVPPVCTAYWQPSDWIAWTDSRGRWTQKTTTNP